MDRSDVLVTLGALLMGVAFWLLLSWAGVLAWVGFLLMSVGIAEVRRR